LLLLELSGGEKGKDCLGQRPNISIKQFVN